MRGRGDTGTGGAPWESRLERGRREGDTGEGGSQRGGRAVCLEAGAGVPRGVRGLGRRQDADEEAGGCARAQPPERVPALSAPA